MRNENFEAKNPSLNSQKVRSLYILFLRIRLRQLIHDHGGYIEEHGDQLCELDALPPETLNKLLREALDKLMDQELYEAQKEREEESEEIRDEEDED